MATIITSNDKARPPRSSNQVSFREFPAITVRRQWLGAAGNIRGSVRFISDFVTIISPVVRF
jgi:hypothetical protein